jgi:predicted TIM-barrel fold metal-dependent hydrolase
MQYRVISTDDHLQEAPDTYTSRMSQKWGDLIPQIRENGDGTQAWYIHGEPRKGPNAVASIHGTMPDRTKPPKRWEEVPPKSYVPAERVKAMVEDGVDVHTFFANIAGIAGNTFSDNRFDEAYRLEAIRAFNDFQMEAYADPFPGRFITLAIVPLWDAGLAIAEMARMKARGVKGVTFAFPQQFGYPHIADPYWDPLWSAAQAANLSINLHIGSGGGQGLGVASSFEGHSEMFRLAEGSTRSISANTQVMATILFSQILERFPRLKVVSSESGLGWVPYLLEVADHQWERQKLWREGMTVKPSAYFHRQCYVNFWFEEIGITMREYIGLDNIMWESDYPHPTCTYPESQKYIAMVTQELTAEEKQKILVGNAVRVFNLDAD